MVAKHHDWTNVKTLWDEFQRSSLKPTSLLCHLVLRSAEKMSDNTLADELRGVMAFYKFPFEPEKFHALSGI